jgi:hypothetical protein
MPTLNEAKYAKLQELTGGVGTINELMYLALATATGGTGHLMELYHLLFDQAGIPTGTFNDRWYQWLGIQGCTQFNLNEREYCYWTTAVVVPVIAPTNLVATAIDSTSIGLTWVDNSTDETGFSIEFSADGIVWGVGASVAANITTYTDTTLIAEQTRFYRVQAVRGLDVSDWSNTDSATTPAAPVVPDAPTGLTATPISTVQINLAWAHNDPLDTFTVERSLVNGSGYVLVASPIAGSTTYSDLGLVTLTPYFYRVRAVNVVGASLPAEATATTL